MNIIIPIPMWALFDKKHHKSTNYGSDHNWDKNYTDEEYYDMVDDD